MAGKHTSLPQQWNQTTRARTAGLWFTEFFNSSPVARWEGWEGCVTGKGGVYVLAEWFSHWGRDHLLGKHGSAENTQMQLLEAVIIQKPSLHLESGKLGCFPGVVAMEWGRGETGSVWNCGTDDTLLRCKFVWLWWSFSSHSRFCQWGGVKVAHTLRNFFRLRNTSLQQLTAREREKKSVRKRKV